MIDVDGVLADGNHRQRFLDQRPRDWKSFFAAAHGDAPIAEVIDQLAAFDPTVTVVLCTSRVHWIRDDTLAWLERHGVHWHWLIMRAKSDGGFTSVQFKRRSVGELRAAGYELLLAVDDDPRNIAMFEDEGIVTSYVHSGYYD